MRQIERNYKMKHDNEYMEDYNENTPNYQLIEDIIRPIADLVIEEGGPNEYDNEYREDYNENTPNYQLIEDIIHPIADLVIEEGGPRSEEHTSELQSLRHLV